MIEHSTAITATFFVYLALMLGIGACAYRSTGSSSGYFLADAASAPGRRPCPQVPRT